MQAIIEFLKILVALAIIAGGLYLIWADGLPVNLGMKWAKPV